MPTQSQLEASARSANEIGRRLMVRITFNERGFSDRTIQALSDYGIDAPERILFMTESELREIPGVGAASIKELKAYRQRFIPTPASNG